MPMQNVRSTNSQSVIEYMCQLIKLSQPRCVTKLNPLAHGPFRIVKKINDVSYKLGLPSHCRINNSFHIRHLKLANDNDDENFPLRRKESIPEPEVQQDGTIEYEVEKIVDHRFRRRRKEYRVRWKGYDAENDTWERASKLTNAQRAIENYEHSLNNLQLNRTRVCGS